MCWRLFTGFMLLVAVESPVNAGSGSDDAALIMAPRFPKSAFPRPSPPGTLETLPSPLLSVLSRPRWASLRLATSRSAVLPLGAGVAAFAASEGRPPAEACGGGGGAKMAFGLPIRKVDKKCKRPFRREHADAGATGQSPVEWGKSCTYPFHPEEPRHACHTPARPVQR